MTSPEAELQKKLQAIATRYIVRTAGDLATLSAHLEACLAGELSRMADIESLAHRIHGSGAMLGFHELSDQACALERLASQLRLHPMLDAGHVPELKERFVALEQSLHRAAAQHGASPA